MNLSPNLLLVVDWKIIRRSFDSSGWNQMIKAIKMNVSMTITWLFRSESLVLLQLSSFFIMHRFNKVFSHKGIKWTFWQDHHQDGVQPKVHIQLGDQKLPKGFMPMEFPISALVLFVEQQQHVFWVCCQNKVAHTDRKWMYWEMKLPRSFMSI